jgi:hypothetical protein
MTGAEHTFIALACTGLAYYFGNAIGKRQAWGEGYSNGVNDGVTTVITTISKEYSLNLMAEIQIDNEEEEK